MMRGWKYNPTGFVFDENADTVCRIAARSDQDEIGRAIAQVPAAVELARHVVNEHDADWDMPPGMVEQARAILDALKGE